MTHEVEIHGMAGGDDSRFLGVIRYDDETKWWDYDSETESAAVLRNIVNTPIRLAGNVDLKSGDDPVKFLNALHKQYRGYGLQAGECVALPTGMTANYATYEVEDVP